MLLFRLFLILALWVCATQVPSARAADAVTSSGLTLTVPAFTVETVFFPGGTIDAFPQRTQYICLNLKTRALHVLGRSIGEGEVVLGQVTTSAAAVTRWEAQAPVLPATHIPRALEKLARGEKLTAACFGSSLVENGSNHGGWQRLLFSPDEPDTAFRVGNVENVSYGVSGSNSRYTVALFGSAKYADGALSSKAFNYDLAIVALLPNGGADRLAVFEGAVRLLRQRGIEVLLLTDNSYAQQGERNGLWGDGNFVRSLAARYGCAVADTAAYMLESDLRGEKVYADMLHQNGAGQRRWAEAIAGVLSPGVPLPAAADPADGPPLKDASQVPGGIDIDFSPQRTGGIEETKGVVNRLAKAYGAPFGRLVLAPGETVAVSHPRLLAVDLVYDSTSAFAIEVRSADGATVVKTLSVEKNAGGRPKTLTLFSASELKEPGDHAWQVAVTQGALGLYAIVYHLPLAVPSKPDAAVAR